MGKKEDGKPAPKSRMNVVIFQLDGSDETMQEGIRTISQALGGALRPAPLILAKPTPALPVVPPVADAESPREDEAPASTNGHDEESEEEQESAARSKSVRIYRTPNILDSLDLTTAPSLKDFCQQKGVTDKDSDSRRYLAIGIWLKNHRQLKEITADHIYTCYRHLGWHPPKDVVGPARSMKNQNGWFSKGSAKGAYTVNHVGESAFNSP